MQLLPNGMYRIKNNSTGETRDVSPADLPSYGLGAPAPQTQAAAAQPMAPTSNVPTSQLVNGQASPSAQPQYMTLDQYNAALKGLSAMPQGNTTQRAQVNTLYKQTNDLWKNSPENPTNKQAAIKASSTKMSNADQVRHDALKTAFSSLDAAQQNLVTAGGAQGAQGELALLPFLGKRINPSGAAYHDTKIELATQLAKAITGGSRPSQQVIEQYLHSLPDVQDPSPYAQNKLVKLRSELLNQAGAFKFDDLVQQYPNDKMPKSGQPSPQQSNQPLGLVGAAGGIANGALNFLLPNTLKVGGQILGSGQDIADQAGALIKSGGQPTAVQLPANRPRLPQDITNPTMSQIPQGIGDMFKTGLPPAFELATTAEAVKGAPGLIKGGGNALGKILHPFNTVSEMRQAAVANAAGKTISGDKIVNALEGIQSKVPSTELDEFNNLLKGAKSAYVGKEIPVGDAVEQIHHLNDAFNASGVVGKSSKALVEKSLGDAFRGELKTVAPDVSQANKLFSYLYSGKKIAQKVAFPAAVSAGAGVGGAALFSSLIGRH